MTQVTTDTVATDDGGDSRAEQVPIEKANVIEARSPLDLAWTRFKTDKVALVAGLVIVALVLIAIGAQLGIWHKLGLDDPNFQDRTKGLSPEGLPYSPRSQFLAGTDGLGRDIFSRLVYGSRISIFVGIASTTISLVIGVTLGMFAGYFGGWVDTVLSRAMDIVLSFPQVLFAIALIAVLQPSLLIVIGVISFFGWPYIGRIVRGQVLSLREKEFIEAARSLGASDVRIIFVDVLPNLVAPIIVYTTLIIPQNILTEATLSFLGLGVPVPTATWGNMLSESIEFYDLAWWYWLFPGLALLTTVLSFNLLGDGLRDALDPRAARTMAK